MELSDAIKQLVPLLVLLPERRQPLQLASHYAAEVFLVETDYGQAVVWVDPFWCDQLTEPVCHIAYAYPVGDPEGERWVDNDPRFGPNCIPYQKPFVLERITQQSPVWKDYRAWQEWRGMKGKVCGRQAAWQRVQQELGEVVGRRIA
jgi:hypothetical protein